ncbi:cellulose binding domain-containing protein, partial [Actinocrinis puniceicyclus]
VVQDSGVWAFTNANSNNNTDDNAFNYNWYNGGATQVATGSPHYNTLTGNTQVSGTNWPTAAQQVINQSGRRAMANTVTVTNPGAQSGTVGTAVSGLQIQAADSGSGQSLTYSASGLPAGLSISSSGLISGTPTVSGTFNVTVTAKDGTGASGSASFTWTIGAGSSGNTVTVTNPGAQSGTVGTAISGVQVQAADSGSGQSLTYSASGLPAGLSISSSGLISGTPTASGTFNVTVTATDSTSASGSASFTWTIGTGSTGGGTCQVSYVKNEWGGGFTANVTVTNTGTSTVNGWTVTWSFPGDQKVTNAWNANVTQSGSAVTATNMSYNPAIAPGGNVQFGFQGTWAGNDTSPSAFTLNGHACS